MPLCETFTTAPIQHDSTIQYSKLSSFRCKTYGMTYGEYSG
jgi:hypothetical protein